MATRPWEGAGVLVETQEAVVLVNGEPVSAFQGSDCRLCMLQYIQSCVYTRSYNPYKDHVHEKALCPSFKIAFGNV